jgi:hypothetical protein
MRVCYTWYVHKDLLIKIQILKYELINSILRAQIVTEIISFGEQPDQIRSNYFPERSFNGVTKFSILCAFECTTVEGIVAVL